MFLRCGKGLVILALVLVTGGHWALLQSAAWVGMAVSYAQESTLSGALKKTFDGKHPCKLCKLVKHGQQKEQKQVTLKTENTFDFSFAAFGAWLFPPLPASQFIVTDASTESRTQSPLTPPPRSA